MNFISMLRWKNLSLCLYLLCDSMLYWLKVARVLDVQSIFFFFRRWNATRWGFSFLSVSYFPRNPHWIEINESGSVLVEMKSACTYKTDMKCSILTWLERESEEHMQFYYFSSPLDCSNPFDLFLDPWGWLVGAMILFPFYFGYHHNRNYVRIYSIFLLMNYW